MTRNTATLVGLAGGIGLAALGLGFLVTSGPSAPDPAHYVGRKEYEDLEARSERLERQAGSLKEEKERIADLNKELESRVAELTEELGKQRELAAAREEEEPVAEVSTVPVSFGKWAELEAVKNANWSEMGEAVANMNELMLEVVDGIKNGEPPGAELQEAIRKENNKLVQYAAQLMGKIPTHSPVNGEFSHPITLANLMYGTLEGTDVPLNDEQRAELAQIGADYESEYDALQSTYTENTTRLEKLIDELELKRDTMDSMQGVLADEQSEILTHPDTHNRLQLDVLSPSTMAVMLARTKNVNSLEEIRGRLPGYLAEWFGVKDVQPETISAISDSWLEEMRPLLTPVKEPERFLHLDLVITAGRAQVKAMNQLLSVPGLSEKSRKSILGHLGWRVPQMVEKAEPPPPANQPEQIGQPGQPNSHVHE